MFCKNCGTKIREGVQFCQNCSKATSVTPQGNILHTQKSLIKGHNLGHELEHCQVCMATSPVRYIEFHQNIGMLFRRSSKSIKAKLCKKCINKYFWDYTLTTLAVGWFGTISFFVTPVFIVNNTFRYIGSLSLKQHY